MNKSSSSDTQQLILTHTQVGGEAAPNPCRRNDTPDPAPEGAFFLVNKRELIPPADTNGSQPPTIIETHDPRTGEVIQFEMTKTGLYAPRYTREDSQNTRNDRWEMKWSLDKLLPDSPQTKCHRWVVPGKDVEIKKSLEYDKSFFTNLQCCGSVWGCPLCAPKITERRRVEVAEGMEISLSRGNDVMLSTFTVPHGMGDNLEAVLNSMLKKVWPKLSQGRSGQELRRLIRLLGTIRVLEVTYGHNGWHPHFHALLFLDGGLSPQEVEDAFWPLWLDGCIKAGLESPSRLHGCRVDDGTRAAQYVTKWGLDAELTKGHLKRGKKSVTPWDLLRVFTFGPEDRRIDPELQELLQALKIDQKRAGALWMTFFKAFKGKRQLYWSNGLRDLLGLKKEKTDKELAEAEMDRLAALLRTLTREEHFLVVKTKSQPMLLTLADDCPELIPDFIQSLRKKGGIQ